MKKTLVLIILILGIGIFTAKAQAYVTPRFIEPDHVTISSTQGISIGSITTNSNNSYMVTLVNNNKNEQGEINSYCFEWYLSYKGERVSDYYQETIRCGKSASRTVYAWPGEVPTENEKYVTAQLGRQSNKPTPKNPRDDD